MIIKKYKDLEKLKNKNGQISIDLTLCNISLRKRVIDFIAGLTINNRTIKKIDKNTFKILLER